MPTKIVFVEVSEAEGKAARRDLIRALERLRRNEVVKEQQILSTVKDNT